MGRCQLSELSGSAGEESIGADHKSTGSQFSQGCEDPIEIAIRAGKQDMELQPEFSGRQLQVL